MYFIPFFCVRICDKSICANFSISVSELEMLVNSCNFGRHRTLKPTLMSQSLDMNMKSRLRSMSNEIGETGSKISKCNDTGNFK